jgi:hypothetical protein
MNAGASDNEVKSVQLELVDEPRHSKRGRRRLLTVRAFVKICHHIEAGFSIPNACALEQVSYRIFRTRCQENPRLEARAKAAQAVRFNLRVEQALDCIMTQAPRNWVAAGWFLERSLPSQFALRNVSRPEESSEPEQEPLPVEVLQHHQALLLEKAHEDEARKAASS